MRNTRVTFVLTVVLATGPLSGGTASQTARSPESSRVVTKATIDRWMKELSNWGRWGKEDERGTLNLITPQMRRRALSAVKEGVSVSLSHNYIEQAAEDAVYPFVREMLPFNPSAQFVGDRYSIRYHGFAHSHMDALCHDSYEGRLYNGFPRSTVAPDTGCAKADITNFKQGIVARAVLVDMARLKGVPHLEPGTPLYVEDLEAWERQARIKVGSGDILLVRTGRWARRAERGAWATGMQAAGLHASVLPWIKTRDVAMLGSDAVSDVLPSGVEGVALPIHDVTLVGMGMPLFDNLDLEAVAAEAAKRGRWEFVVVAAPLAVERGTGSPLNPIAIF
jgi:kynurenine formamidase